MKRKEKIKLLQAINDGKLSIADLESPQVYFFIQTTDKLGIYEMNGREYNEKEYLDFCLKVEHKNNNSIIWNEGKEYPKEDKIIKIVFP